MAFVNVNTNTDSGIALRASAFIKDATERYAQWRVFRKTVHELRVLSSRDLADLGIDRSMIKSISLEAAYGKK